MNLAQHEVLSSPELLASRSRHFSRLSDVYSGRSPRRGFFLNGVTCDQGETILYQKPEEWVHNALGYLAGQAGALLNRDVFRPLVVQCEVYGVHYVDRTFGANVYRKENQWWADYINRPVGTLEPPDLENDATWRLACCTAEAFLASGVKAPVFALPTIASALNVGVNLYGEELLISMITDPDAAAHDLAIINSVQQAQHRWFLDHIPLEQLQPVRAVVRCQPPGYGQLCGCSTHLLSARQYRDFAAPLDDALLSTYPHGGMIHLCGAHVQHIPVWREMKSLRAVQLNDRAADDFVAYYQGLRDDQVIYLRPTPAMTVERIYELSNGGHRVVFMCQPPRGWFGQAVND